MKRPASNYEENKPEALIGAVIKTTCDIQSDFKNRTIPEGTTGVVIECYDHPSEGYCVDLAIPTRTLLSDAKSEAS